MGWFNDIVNGKEKTIKADPLAGDINNAARSGLSMLQQGGTALQSIYSQDPTATVNSQIGLENKMMRGAANDATRNTRALIAQRGLGSSSIGLGQEVNQAKSLSDKLAMNKASGLSRIRDMSIQNGQGLMNTGNALYAPKGAQGVQMQDQTYRSGGYGQLLAAGIQGGAMAMGK